MTIPSYERRSFTEIAVETTLAIGINDTDTTIVLDAATGWPTGASGDFYIRIENETIRIDTRTSTTLSVLSGGRGANSTTAASHVAGVAVVVVYTAFDADEANYVVAETVGKITATGSVLVGDGVNSLAELVKGTSGLPLVAGASTLSYAQLAASGIASDAVTTAKILDANVTAAKLATDAVTTAKIDTGAVTAAELASDAVTTAKILNANVTTAKIADLNVTTGKLADAAVTADKLASAVAGAGLTGGAGTALAVVVDDTTIAIDTDTLEVKDAGVTSTQLAADLGRGALSSGYASVTADQTGIGAGADLTSLTVTVTVRASSRIKITGYCTLIGGTTLNAFDLNIKEGATVLQACKGHVVTANEGDSYMVQVILTPSTGSHTYKLNATRTAGAGTLALSASSTNPAYILVEDVGS